MIQYFYQMDIDGSVSIVGVDTLVHEGVLHVSGRIQVEGEYMPIRLTDEILQSACGFTEVDDNFIFNDVSIHREVTGAYNIGNCDLIFLHDLQTYWYNRFSQNLTVNLEMLRDLL